MLSFVKFGLLFSTGFIFGYILNSILTKKRNEEWVFGVIDHYQGLLTDEFERVVEDKKMDEERKGEGYFNCLKCGKDIYQEDIGDVLDGQYVIGPGDNTMRLKTNSTVVCKDCCPE